MARIPEAAVRHYQEIQRLQTDAVAAGHEAWSRVDPGALSASWGAQLSRLTVTVAVLQVAAADSGGSYTGMTLAQQGEYVLPQGLVDPTAWGGGWASDGRPLSGLLYSPVTSTKQYIGEGYEPSQALTMGQSKLDTILSTQIADAARSATSVDITTRQGVGYVRMANPPTCSRCAILAGRFYRWNSGFLRHPNCDCVHVPSTDKSTEGARAEGLIDDPYEYFKSLDEADQDRVFTKAGAQAIRDGADMSQVSNAISRGRRGSFTTEGTSRGYASRQLRQGQRRMTPEAIYRLNPNREDAIAALRQQGYILPQGQVAGGAIRGPYPAVNPGTRRMTAAEARVARATHDWEQVQQGRNPYRKDGAKLTAKTAATVEQNYRRWLATNGEIYVRKDATP